MDHLWRQRNEVDETHGGARSTEGNPYGEARPTRLGKTRVLADQDLRARSNSTEWREATHDGRIAR